MFKDNADSCQYGTECGMHYRVNQHVTDGTISLLDYVDEYCVLTTLTSDEEVAQGIAIAFLTGQEPDYVDARTFIFRVGSGSVADLASAENLLDAQIRAWDIRIPTDAISADLSYEEFEVALRDSILAAHMEHVEKVMSGSF